MKKRALIFLGTLVVLAALVMLGGVPVTVSVAAVVVLLLACTLSLAV